MSPEQRVRARLISATAGVFLGVATTVGTLEVPTFTKEKQWPNHPLRDTVCDIGIMTTVLSSWIAMRSNRKLREIQSTDSSDFVEHNMNNLPDHTCDPRISAPLFQRQ